jgi:hypothetical protein
MPLRTKYQGAVRCLLCFGPETRHKRDMEDIGAVQADEIA